MRGQLQQRRDIPPRQPSLLKLARHASRLGSGAALSLLGLADRLASGISGDQHADAWMDINAAHSGKNTWNAVAMDRRGYFWIEAKRPNATDKEFYTTVFGHKPVIKGPASIM